MQSVGRPAEESLRSARRLLVMADGGECNVFAEKEEEGSPVRSSTPRDQELAAHRRPQSRCSRILRPVRTPQRLFQQLLLLAGQWLGSRVSDARRGCARLQSAGQGKPRDAEPIQRDQRR